MTPYYKEDSTILKRNASGPLLRIAILSVIVIAFIVVYLRFVQAVPAPKCGTTIDNPCGEQKATALAIEATTMVQTAEATPYETTVPLETPEGTVVPAGYIPPEAQKIAPFGDLRNLAGDHTFDGASSVWLAGAVPTTDGTDYARMFVWAHPGNDGFPWIGLDLLDGSPQRKQFNQSWEAPDKIGAITITGVPETINDPNKGPRGLITFTTALGFKGTLDVGTGTWSYTKGQ